MVVCIIMNSWGTVVVTGIPDISEHSVCGAGKSWLGVWYSLSHGCDNIQISAQFPDIIIITWINRNKVSNEILVLPIRLATQAYPGIGAIETNWFNW